MKRLTLLLGLLCVISANASTLPREMGAQVSSGYRELAASELLKASRQHSAALTRAGFIPAESFTDAAVGLDGQSVHPGGHIEATSCVYRFRNGALREIDRVDLFEDKGPASLILRHLTNEVLTLKTQDAPARALAVLRCLAYDTTAISNAYRITVRDDLMEGHPVRDGGPNFPRDLRFFGELISRKKIHIYVEFAPKRPALVTNLWELADIRIEFLATTGELLKARIAGPEAFAALGIPAPARIPAIETPDFTPPVFATASRKLALPPATISTTDAVTLLRQVWGDLQQKLGPDHAQCYLLCDNLNQPDAIAREFAKLAAKKPWAGASHLWCNDLPFDRALMDRLSRDRRGLAVLAIGGKAKTQLDAIRDLADIPVPRSGDKDSMARFTNDRVRLQPRVIELVNRIMPPASMPDTALFTIQASPNFASRVVSDEIESRARAWAQVFDVSGSRPYNSIGDGVTYYDGAALTNTLVVLRLSGSLPLRLDPVSLMHHERERRLISHEISRPVSDLAYSFGPHPMQELFGLLGPDLIALLQQADRVEAFRIKPNMFGEPSAPGRPNLEGHEILARGKSLGPDFAKQIAASILNDKNEIGVMAECEFMPRDAFHLWRGKASAILLICFECHEIQVRHYAATGSLAREARFYLGANSDALAHLVKQAMPAAAAPQKRKARR